MENKKRQNVEINKKSIKIIVEKLAKIEENSKKNMKMMIDAQCYKFGH